MANKARYSIAIHGGAFVDKKDFTAQTEYLRHVLKQSSEILKQGGSALGAVSCAVELMEDSGLYIAGKGSGPNSAGYVELDASIMDGATGRAGAVAGLRNFKNPIHCARAVMEKTPHVLLVAEGAANFCRAQNLEEVDDDYFVPAHKASQVKTMPSHGTVGAVALDQKGNLAAATSTGGLVGKMEGRVGDSPLIGSATWADKNLAVSTTGLGEFFIRDVAAYKTAALCQYGGRALEDAAGQVIQDIQKKGGWGGLIAMDKDGKPQFRFSNGMHRGHTDESGEIFVASNPGTYIHS